MGRIFNVVLLGIMLIGAIVTYDMKHKAEKAADRVTRLEAEVQREKEAIQLLRAELSARLQPGRLQAIVEHYPEHFKLEPFLPSQYATIDEIPPRPVEPADPRAMADVIAKEAVGAIR